jgi:hypothetical protein
MTAAKQFDVFLSYHHSDAAWAIYLKQSLESRGVTVWLDKHEIKPGDRFSAALEDGIAESRSVAVIISPASMKSQWVRDEYELALTLSNSKPGYRVIGCLLKDVRVRGFLANRQHVDFRDPSTFEQKVDELCTSLVPSRPQNAWSFDTATRGDARDDMSPATSWINTVMDEQIRYLETVVRGLEKDRYGVMAFRACAPAWGLAVLAFVSATPWQYLGAAFVTGLVGFGATERAWSRTASALKKNVALLNAVVMCKRAPAPVCPDVMAAFNQCVRRSINVE